MKFLKWMLFIIACVVIVLPIEIVTYSAEVKAAQWIYDKLGLG